MRVVQERSLNTNSITIASPIFSKASWPFSFTRKLSHILAKFGVGIAVNRYSSSLSIYNQSQYLSFFTKENININIGSGGFYHQCWINLDLPGNTSYYREIQGINSKNFRPINLCLPSLELPFQSSSVNTIYISHTLEHLDLSSISRLFLEIKRVLAPNGICRIVLPDTKKELDYLRYLFNSGQEDQFLSSVHEVAYHVFSPTKGLTTAQLIEALTETDFDGNQFIAYCEYKFGLSSVFNPATPDHHITFLDYERLASIASQYDLKASQKLRWDSDSPRLVNPFLFDLTEPHISFFTELTSQSK